MTHPAPNSEREMLGSSLRDTHRAAEDQWAVLEGLACEAHNEAPAPWAVKPRERGPHGNHPSELVDANGEWIASFDGAKEQAFAAAANPATVLKLIEAARASQVGMSEANEPKPDVAGARERLEGYLEGELHLLQDADLRLILSAYDRQGEEIERLRGADLCKADLWWNPGNDEAGFTHYADAFEDANEDGGDYSVELNRGIVLPSVWAALINGKVKVFATEAEADEARARPGGPDHG